MINTIARTRSNHPNLYPINYQTLFDSLTAINLKMHRTKLHPQPLHYMPKLSNHSKTTNSLYKLNTTNQPELDTSQQKHIQTHKYLHITLMHAPCHHCQLYSRFVDGPYKKTQSFITRIELIVLVQYAVRIDDAKATSLSASRSEHRKCNCQRKKSTTNDRQG